MATDGWQFAGFVLVVREAADQAHDPLCEALRLVAPIQFCHPSDAWRSVVDSEVSRLRGVVLLLPSKGRASSVALARRAGGNARWSPLVVAGTAKQLAMSNLAKLALAGATHTVMLDGETHETLREQVEEIFMPPLPAQVLTLLSGAVSGRSRTIFGCALQKAASPLRASDVAAWFGSSVRTCDRRLSEGGVGSLSHVIGYCRVVRAACMLATSHHSIVGVALALRFPSEQALRMQVRRRLHVTPSECTAESVLRIVGDALPRTSRAVGESGVCQEDATCPVP